MRWPRNPLACAGPVEVVVRADQARPGRATATAAARRPAHPAQALDRDPGEHRADRDRSLGQGDGRPGVVGPDPARASRTGSAARPAGSPSPATAAAACTRHDEPGQQARHLSAPAASGNGASARASAP